jgi:DNA-binding LacI/PurR family transcriptional regulator/two-component sensor histidine kinase
MDRARPVIGVMLDNVDDGYQRAIWAGLERAGQDADVDILNFLGGHLDPDDPAFRHRNGIFELIGPELLDGLVVASTVMASHIGNARLDEYCRRFRPLPMVGLGVELRSMPSLVCEGREALRALLEHLVGRHGRRRFAYVAGSANNNDTAVRERVLREVLAEKGLSLDPRLLLRGDYRPEQAGAVVEEALDRGLSFDAVVCANDEMAIGVMEALERRAVPIPDEVSVAGFDDIARAQHQTLPLTTVRQPIVELSRRAIATLLHAIRGQAQPAPVELPAELVIRRSCGCLSHAVQRAGARAPRLAAGGPRAPTGVAASAAAEAATEAVTEAVTEATLASLGRSPAAAALGASGRECAASLAQALAAEVEGARPAGTFLGRLDVALRSAFGAHLSDEAWEALLTDLRREALARLAPAEVVEARVHQARVLLTESARQQQWRDYTALARKTQRLQYVIENLIGSFDVPTLLDSMARELPRIGIHRCYLAVHAAPERPYQDARLVLAFDEQGRKDVGEGLVYPARQLLPEGIAPAGRLNLAWQPLVFGEQEVGFIGLSFDTLEHVSSLALAQQIRSALKASLMMHEIREKDRLLLRVDRMRSEFVANITHDFRSLVAIIMDSSSVGMEPDERRGPAELRELAGIVYEASLKLKVAIDRLLDLASMDEHGLVLRVRKLRPRRYLAELAAFYRPVLAVSGIALEEALPPQEVEDLYTDPDKVEQIMHNLVSNAAKFVAPGRGRIRLALAVRDGAVEISVEDDGEGIAPERLESIFVRFNAQKRRARRGGSGIGLAFVKELAAYLKGSIAAASAGPGKGARFTLTLRRGKDVLGAEAAREEEGEGEGARDTEAVRTQARQLLESSLRGKMAQGARPARG